MRDLLNKLKRDFSNRENLDIYVTILASFVVAGLGLAGIVEVSIILAALLGIMAIVSMSLLINRDSQERIQLALRENESGIQEALERIEPHCLSERFFRKDYPSLNIRPLIRKAHSAFFWGFAFTSIIPSLRDDFERGILNGLQLKFLFIKPGSEAAEMAVSGSEKQDKSDFDHAVRGNLRILTNISRRLQKNSVEEGLELKVNNYLPPFSLIAIDPELPGGKMFVRIASYRMNRTEVPWFELDREVDRTWFKVFLTQFNSIWKESEEWDED